MGFSTRSDQGIHNNVALYHDVVIRKYAVPRVGRRDIVCARACAARCPKTRNMIGNRKRRCTVRDTHTRPLQRWRWCRNNGVQLQKLNTKQLGPRQRRGIQKLSRPRHPLYAGYAGGGGGEGEIGVRLCAEGKAQPRPCASRTLVRCVNERELSYGE